MIRPICRASRLWPALAALAVADRAQGAVLALSTHGPEPTSAAALDDSLSRASATVPEWSSITAIPDLEAEPAVARWYRSSDEPPGDYWIDSEGYYTTLYRRFSVSVGAAAYSHFRTNMQISSPSGVGADLDMEDLLGLDNSDTIGRIDAQYAFNRRHWLQASYYDIERSGEKDIPNDIQVGDVVIPAGPVNSEFNTAIFKLSYRYNFVSDLRTVIGASFGLHVMELDTAIRSQSINVSETFRVTAPLPVLGLHGAYALSRRWKLSAGVEFLQFDLGDYQGLITDTRLTLENDTFEHFGWGIGFNGFQADAEFKGHDDLTSDIEYGYQGLMLYVRMMF